MRSITASFGNTVQVGIPLAAALFGESGLALHITIVSLHSLTLLTALTALVELDLAREQRRADPGSSTSWACSRHGEEHRHPSGDPAGRDRAGVERERHRPARVVDELLATLGSAVVRSAWC